jgi:hypothetical protein
MDFSGTSYLQEEIYLSAEHPGIGPSVLGVRTSQSNPFRWISWKQVQRNFELLQRKRSFHVPRNLSAADLAHNTEPNGVPLLKTQKNCWSKKEDQ